MPKPRRIELSNSPNAIDVYLVEQASGHIEWVTQPLPTEAVKMVVKTTRPPLMAR